MAVVQCPECLTRFKVSSQRIGDGRDVRCGECHHVWHQHPIEDDPAAEAALDKEKESLAGLEVHENDFDSSVAEAMANMPEGINPEQSDKKEALVVEDEEGKAISTKTAVTVFASLLIITVGIFVAMQSSIVQIWPKSESIYAVISLDTEHPWNGLKMTNGFATYREDAEAGKLLYVEVEITNITDEAISLPALEVEFMDSDTDEVLKTWYPDIQSMDLGAGEMHPVKLGFTDFVKDRGYVKLSFVYRNE